MGKIDTWWLEYSLKAMHTGSRVICYPPVEDTDDDYILLVDEGLALKLEEELTLKGWKKNQKDYSRKTRDMLLSAYPSDQAFYDKDGSIFHSWRKDDLNLILTASDEYFTNFCKATMLARELNLKNKDSRISLFEAICRDRWPIPPSRLFMVGEFRDYNIKLL